MATLSNRNILALCLLLLLGTACEDVVSIDIAESDPVLVVDAMITDQPGAQNVRLIRSQGYLSNTFNPPVTGAVVTVSDDAGNTFAFADQGNGDYIWQPDSTEVLGQIGRNYVLNIALDGESYRAVSAINEVPPIDSISFEYREEELGSPEGYYGQVYARDLPGPGDCYWIKTWKNDTLLNKPLELIVAYDASFSAGANTDGITFILPVREGINPIDDTEATNDDEAPYALGDEAYVELHAITQETFFFLQQLQIQTINGGLFAVPATNVPSNVFNTDPNSTEQVQGWFGCSAVSSARNTVTE